MKKLLLIMTTGLLLHSCGNKPKQIYIDTDYTSHYSMETEDVIRVPYEERGGVKHLKVKVNGMELTMILDPGSSNTLISKAEADYMYAKGWLTDTHFMGTQQARIADGSIIENQIVILDEIVIGEKISCKNVEASIAENVTAPLLLGNEVLDRVASYTVDNINKVIEFKLKQR